MYLYKLNLIDIIMCFNKVSNLVRIPITEQLKYIVQPKRNKMK